MAHRGEGVASTAVATDHPFQRSPRQRQGEQVLHASGGLPLMVSMELVRPTAAVSSISTPSVVSHSSCFVKPVCPAVHALSGSECQAQSRPGYSDAESVCLTSTSSSGQYFRLQLEPELMASEGNESTQHSDPQIEGQGGGILPFRLSPLAPPFVPGGMVLERETQLGEVVSVQHPLDLEGFRKGLHGCPDQELVQFVLHAIQHGLELGHSTELPARNPFQCRNGWLSKAEAKV